jgi:cysteine synthase B
MLSHPLRLARPNQGSENESILSRIGRTPLFRLERIDRAFSDISLYAKAEWLNPGGSVKDRPALRMILAAEADGRLRPGMTILDATSGNTGIGYAMIGAARGYRVHLALPANASRERIRILEAYGTKLTLTDPALGTDGSIQAARAIAAAKPPMVGHFFRPIEGGMNRRIGEQRDQIFQNIFCPANLVHPVVY